MATETLGIRKPNKATRKRPSKAVRLRRVNVSGMLVRRVPQYQIAQALGVSSATISHDVSAIEDEWRHEMMSSMTTIKARELAELGTVEAEAWVGFQRTRKASDGSRLPGDPKWLKVVLDCKKRRSDLLGLDAPIEVRHGLSDRDLRELTDDELDELARQVQDGTVMSVATVH